MERRQSQEFRNLCVKFDEKEGGGVGNDVRRKPESNPSRGLNCSFANVTGPSPGPSQGRGAQRKLIYKQTKLSFDVVRGSSRLVSPSTNQKRAQDTDSVEAGGWLKKRRVL